MATDLSFIDYLRDQLSSASNITFKKMFGEYAMYCDDKLVALVCDNQFFLKLTAGGRERLLALGDISEVPPYPGAKPSFLIDDLLDDRETLQQLIQITALEVPLPKPKKAKKKL